MLTVKYPDSIASKFKFITIAALRCRQLQKGAKPRISSRSKKFTTIAQEEVLEGQVEHSVLTTEQIAESAAKDASRT